MTLVTVLMAIAPVQHTAATKELAQVATVMTTQVTQLIISIQLLVAHRLHPVRTPHLKRPAQLAASAQLVPRLRTLKFQQDIIQLAETVAL